MVLTPLADWKVRLLSMGMLGWKEESGCCVDRLLEREVIGRQDRHNVVSYTKIRQDPS